MNTTTLALAAAGVYFLTRPKTTGDTDAAGTGAMGTGPANAGGMGALSGMSFADLKARSVPGGWASYLASGYQGITQTDAMYAAGNPGTYDGVVKLDPDQQAALIVLLTAYGVREPHVTIGKRGAKALPPSDIGKISIKVLDASAGVGNTTTKKLTSGVRGFDGGIVIEHRKDSGLGAQLANAGANAAGDFVSNTLKTLLPK